MILLHGAEAALKRRRNGPCRARVTAGPAAPVLARRGGVPARSLCWCWSGHAPAS